MTGAWLEHSILTEVASKCAVVARGELGVAAEGTAWERRGVGTPYSCDLLKVGKALVMTKTTDLGQD